MIWNILFILTHGYCFCSGKNGLQGLLSDKRRQGGRVEGGADMPGEQSRVVERSQTDRQTSQSVQTSLFLRKHFCEEAISPLDKADIFLLFMSEF